jgi:pimeloyl-ACP methyl ester carboxylesterase
LWNIAYRIILLYSSGLSAQANLVVEQLFPLEEQEIYKSILYEQIMQSDPNGYRNSIRALARFNVIKDLRDLNLPTLVISGENDTTVPLEVQKQLAEQIPGSEQIIINSAGHAVTVEQPEEFNRNMITFLLAGN